MKQKKPTASRLRVPRIGPAIIPRYCCDCPKARLNPTKKAAPPIAKSKKFGHGTSRVTGNLAKKGKLTNPTRQSRNPAHRCQFQRRLFIDVPPDDWLQCTRRCRAYQAHCTRQPKDLGVLPGSSDLPNPQPLNNSKSQHWFGNQCDDPFVAILNGTTRISTKFEPKDRGVHNQADLCQSPRQHP